MSMAGKVCLITGATNGIGRATAKALVEQGAELFILCRNEEKGQALLDELRSLRPDAELCLLIADLGKMADIRRAAKQFLDTGKPLHLLLNNAGVVNTERKLSADGIEETFAVNHLAYFLLTELLRERIVASAPARQRALCRWHRKLMLSAKACSLTTWSLPDRNTKPSKCTATPNSAIFCGPAIWPSNSKVLA